MLSTAEVSADAIFREISLARGRVYVMDQRSPMQSVALPLAGGRSVECLVKREDLSRIHSFKWRGAANRVSVVKERQEGDSVVAASAGNHAQGVALAAAKLGLRATIFMPRSTPRIKISEVQRFGGSSVTVRLEGDAFDDTQAAARVFAAQHGSVLVHPFDDPYVIAGQGTIGDEVMRDGVDPDIVYICVGGGGLAAGVAVAMKAHRPGIEIVGVEAEGQDSMRRAVEAGGPVEMAELDRFCDGTAVRRAGVLTHALCSRLVDRWVTVSNDQVCAAIQFVWETLRAIPEPSGALGITAALAERERLAGRRPLAILSGANLDMMTLPVIARRARIGRSVRRFYAFEIDETAGSLVSLLHQIGDAFNIVDFQYGKVDEQHAEPVIGFESSPEMIARLGDRLEEIGVPYRDVSSNQSVDFRVIPVRPDLFRLPYFATITFPDRGGALREFMDRVGTLASICYFNFTSTGETEGKAMMGFEFVSSEQREGFIEMLRDAGVGVHHLGADELAFHEGA